MQLQDNLVYNSLLGYYMDKGVSATPDHDLLIALNVKVDRLTADMRDNNTDNTTRIARVETRLDAIDNYHAGIDLPHFKANSEFVDDLRANWKFIIGISGIALAIIQVAVTVITHYYLK